MAVDSQFAGRKVLLTGASGFIGQHLGQRLADLGAEVHGVSRSDSARSGCMCWWQGDLADGDRVAELLSTIRPEYIFHLASHVAGSRDLSLVMPTLHSNLISTVNLLTGAAEIGCRRVLLTGSLEEPQNGAANPVPCSPYAVTKWASSGYARMFHSLYELPVVTLRVFMVYGPGQQDLKKLVPSVILSLLRGQAPELSSGTREVDWIYVDDVVDGFLAAAAASGLEGQTVDVGSGRLVPIRSVVEELVSIVNPDVAPRFGALPDRPMEQVRVADTNRSQQLMGWSPTISLAEGLRRTADWYKERLHKGLL